MKDKLRVSWNTTILRLVEERLKVEAPVEYERYVRLDEEGKWEYIKKNMKKLDVGYDKELLDKINTILHPLLESVVTEEINKEIVENHIPRSEYSMHQIFEFRNILQRYANYVKPRSPEEESRLSLPYYLIIVESVYTANVNLLIYLLTKSGKTYYRLKKDGSKKYKPSINNLERISGEKLNDRLIFLRENRFKMISDACDRHLRNSIAHMNVIVFTNGSVAYERESGKVSPITKKELENKIVEILSVCQCINESLRKFYDKKYG